MKNALSLIVFLQWTSIQTLSSQHLISKPVELQAHEELNLNSQFRNYEITEINLNNLSSSLKRKRDYSSFSITLNDEVLTIQIIQNEIRSAAYQSASPKTGLSNFRGACITYKGRVKEDPSSDVRLSISKNMFKGYIMTHGQFYYFDQMNKFVTESQNNKIIAYRTEDIIERNERTCGFKAEEEKAFINKIQSQSLSLQSTPISCRVLELATEADYEYFISYAGPTGPGANNEILANINMIHGLYLTTFNIDIVVVYQHVWTTSSDPYSAFQAYQEGDNLDEFKNYWNSNFSSVKRDLSILFSGRSANIGGIAYGSTVCSSPSYAYCIVIDGTQTDGIAAHEIGHTLGAIHGDSENCGTANATLMCWGALGTPYTYSNATIATVNNYLNNNDACLFEFNQIDISGADIMCSNQTKTYTFDPLLSDINLDPFTGGTLNWSVDNANLTITGGQGTSSVTVKANSGSGYTTLTATYSDADFNCDLAGSKTIWVGKPALSGSSGLTVSPFSVDPGDDVYYSHSPTDIPGATSYSEQVTFPPTPQHFTFSSVDDLNGSIYVKTSAPASTYSFIIKAQNTCGYRSYSGSFQVEGSGGGGCGFFCFSVSPNPSGDFIDINAEENPEMKTLSTEATTKTKATEDNKYQFALFDLQHNLVMKGKTKKFNARLDVRNINPGHYILHISDKGGTVKQHVLIE